MSKKHKHHKHHKDDNKSSRFLGSEILTILLLFVMIAFIFPRFFGVDEEDII